MLLFAVRDGQGIIAEEHTVQAQAWFQMDLVEMHALQPGAFGLDDSEEGASKKHENIDEMLFDVFKVG